MVKKSKIKNQGTKVSKYTLSIGDAMYGDAKKS
jgi:hypothetical protein